MNNYLQFFILSGGQRRDWHDYFDIKISLDETFAIFLKKLANTPMIELVMHTWRWIYSMKDDEKVRLIRVKSRTMDEAYSKYEVKLAEICATIYTALQMNIKSAVSQNSLAEY